MTAVLHAVFVAFVLSGPADSQPGAITCDTGVRHIEVPAVPRGALATVCVSPGWPTLFSFDVELATDSLSLEGRDAFSLVEHGRSTLKLVPSEKLTAGKRLPMTVRFKDSAAPTSAAFMLVVQAAQAEPLVNVYRQVRSAESYEQELAETKAKVRQLTEENVQLRVERSGPGGLAGLRVSGLIRRGGVESRDITKSVTPAATNAFATRKVTAYRATGRVAVDASLQLPEGVPAWRPESATLTLQGKKGVELKVVTLWPLEPDAPGEHRSSVFVEAETGPDEVVGTFTLKLWEAGGARTVTLRGITFP